MRKWKLFTYAEIYVIGLNPLLRTCVPANATIQFKKNMLVNALLKVIDTILDHRILKLLIIHLTIPQIAFIRKGKKGCVLHLI